MSDLFERCHAFTAKWEGGLTDDAADAGGLTNWGVSIVFLSDMAARHPGVVTSLGITMPVTREVVRGLTRKQAEGLFRAEFWTPLRCDEFPPSVALCLYDMAVNHGRAGAVRILQRACNAYWEKPGLAVDGILGPKTMGAAQKMGGCHGLTLIAESRQRYYDDIIARKPSQKKFKRGWENRCRAMLAEAQALALAEV